MHNSTDNKIISFLSDKPLWVWLLTFLVITGVLFGAFSLALYLLGIVPWIGVLIIIVAGLVWGGTMYLLHRHDDSRPGEEGREGN